MNTLTAGRTELIKPEIQTPRIDRHRLADRLRFSPAAGIKKTRLHELVELVEQNCQAQAVYRQSRLTVLQNGSVRIDGEGIDYPLVRVNLAKATSVFPFAVSCGAGIDYVKSSVQQEEYILEIVKKLLLDNLVDNLRDYLTRQNNLSYLWSLVCGEMQAWPAKGYPALFSILGGLKDQTGISLTAEGQISPPLSAAGLFYYVETEFEGCQVCSSEPCMMRRAQYNPELASIKGLRVRKVCGKDTA